MKVDQTARLKLGSFELDMRSGQLCALEGDSAGRRTLLQEQPFRVLRILIERSGQIATREEIKKRLWPNDTVVDFDHSINVAIGTLRRAFGDSAAQPTYIETLGRRGYRLIVAVEPVTSVRNGELSVHEPAEPATEGGLIGKKVSHFRVIEVIGGGGMGMVYRAEDLKLCRPVALKFLPEELSSDPTSLRRFEREAQTASSLNHPNICTVFEIEEYEGQPLIVMELLDGLTLRDRLATSQKIYLDEVLEISTQACSGLHADHARGIIHRDVKPANIFLTNEGRIKLLDFGLAKLMQSEDGAETHRTDGSIPAASSINGTAHAVDSSLTRTGAAAGTASYMSPEQIRREKLDARSDIFSFGLVLYEMVTGQRAFHGDSVTAVHEALLNRTPTPVHDLNAEVPPGLAEVIAKAVHKDPQSRYQSADELSAALELVVSPARLRRRKLRLRLGIAAMLLLLVGGGYASWRYLTRFQLTAADTIVIADLDNRTSDPVLDDALNTALPVELAQTPFLQVLAQDKVRETMKELNYPTGGKVTADIARAVCLKTNSKAVVTSSISDAGNHFRILLTGINCQSGKVFATSEQNAALRGGIIHSLGVAGFQLRGSMGESRASLKKFDVPLEMATSASPEALQFLAKAFRQHVSPDVSGTIALYERAIDIDPNFALAYASVGTQYLQMGNMPKAIQNETKAYELRYRLTGQLKYLAETLYYDAGLQDLITALPIYQEWLQTFPLDGVAHHNYAGELYLLGRYDESAAEAREAIRLMPQLGVGGYSALIYSTVYAGRLEEAKLIAAEAKAKKWDDWRVHVMLHLIAFLQNDDPTMHAEEQWLDAHGHPGYAAYVSAYYGRFGDSLRRTEEIEKQVGSTSVIADGLYDRLALNEAEVGELGSVERILKRRFPPRQPQAAVTDLALALARTGHAQEAESMAAGFDHTLPHHTLVQFYTLPTIRAAIKLSQNDPAGAIRLLEPTRDYEFVDAPGFDSIYPAYIRGLAYLKLGQGDPAAHEFQKLIDHPAIVGRDVIGALAHLQMGRAQAMSGNRDAARGSYQDFLKIWKDADPDIPIYKQAKAEYASLL